MEKEAGEERTSEVCYFEVLYGAASESVWDNLLLLLLGPRWPYEMPLGGNIILGAKACHLGCKV